MCSEYVVNIVIPHGHHLKKQQLLVLGNSWAVSRQARAKTDKKLFWSNIARQFLGHARAETDQKLLWFGNC